MYSNFYNNFEYINKLFKYLFYTDRHFNESFKNIHEKCHAGS